MANRGTACPPKVLLQLAFDYELQCDYSEITSMLCNSNLMDLMHKRIAGKLFKHNLQDMLLSAPWLQIYLMCRKHLFIMRMYASVERGHTFRYTIPSCTRMYRNSSPAGREVPMCILPYQRILAKGSIRERSTYTTVH